MEQRRDTVTEISTDELAKHIKMLAANLNESSKAAAKRGLNVDIQVHEITTINAQTTCVIDLTVSKFL